MAKKSHRLGRFLTAAALVGAAAGAWYYLKNRDASKEDAAGSDEDFDDFDNFDDFDKLDDEEPEIVHASETKDASQKEDASMDDDAAQQGSGRSYVSLDLKKAKEKADAFLDNVSDKVEDTVKKIKTSEEYETVANKVDDAVTRFRNSEEFEAVTNKINDTVDRIRNSNEYANVDEQMENALNKVKEVTEKPSIELDSASTSRWEARNGWEILTGLKRRRLCPQKPMEPKRPFLQMKREKRLLTLRQHRKERTLHLLLTAAFPDASLFHYPKCICAGQQRPGALFFISAVYINAALHTTGRHF